MIKLKKILENKIKKNKDNIKKWKRQMKKRLFRKTK